ncbi:MAG TPA: hypothetical protein VN809_06905 [Telmatospirillum sp.]|nr:hypothetical protein [Telmatospirillum sp.]
MDGIANIGSYSVPSAPQGGGCPPPNPFAARFELPPAPSAACLPPELGRASAGPLLLGVQILSTLLQAQDLTQPLGQDPGGGVHFDVLTMAPFLAAEAAWLLRQRQKAAKPDQADKGSEEDEGAEEGKNGDVKKGRARQNADEDGEDDQLMS